MTSTAGSTPYCVRALAHRNSVRCCGSRSASMTLSPTSMPTTASERDRVDLPTPPFWLRNATIAGIASPRVLLAGPPARLEKLQASPLRYLTTRLAAVPGPSPPVTGGHLHSPVIERNHAVTRRGPRIRGGSVGMSRPASAQGPQGPVNAQRKAWAHVSAPCDPLSRHQPGGAEPRPAGHQVVRARLCRWPACRLALRPRAARHAAAVACRTQAVSSGSRQRPASVQCHRRGGGRPSRRRPALRAAVLLGASWRDPRRVARRHGLPR